MTVLLVVLLGLGTASSLNLGNPTGLHFDLNNEYATSYEDYKPRDYKFEYGVSDPHTGDHKYQWEVRENGVVRGEYSLLEPDGTTRVVQYTADKHGFRAVVKKLGHAIHAPQHHHGLHETPIAVPEIQSGEVQQPYFKTYDGNADNYNNIIDESNLASLLSYNNHISDNRVPNSYTHEPIVLSHSLTESGAEYHNYPSPEIVGHSEHPQIYSHELGYSENHVPIPQEPVHIPEPIQSHAPIHVIESIHQQPVYSYESSQSQGPISETIKISPSFPSHEAIRIQEPTKIQENLNAIYNSREIQAAIGLKVEHPHGESSSSFIGSTGNPDDDSEYTRHQTGTLVRPDHSGWKAYERPIPYQHLKSPSLTN